jgi:peroxiredoxin
MGIYRGRHRNVNTPQAVFPRVAGARRGRRGSALPAARRFFEGIVGLAGYNWRFIAGTRSRSYHSYAIAVDLVPRSYGGKHAYWRWAMDQTEDWHALPYASRWMVPPVRPEVGPQVRPSGLPPEKPRRCFARRVARLCRRTLCSTIAGMKPTVRISFLIALVVIGAARAAAVGVGAKAPPFANPDLQNKYVMSRDLLGKGWVILDFFATDCEGCKKELPVLEKLRADYAGLGLVVLVFATDAEGARVVEPYLRERPTSLPIVLDRYQVTTKKYGVTEIPSLFLVDPAGDVVFAAVGFREDLYEVLKLLLEADR